MAARRKIMGQAIARQTASVLGQRILANQLRPPPWQSFREALPLLLSGRGTKVMAMVVQPPSRGNTSPPAPSAAGVVARNFFHRPPSSSFRAAQTPSFPRGFRPRAHAAAPAIVSLPQRFEFAPASCRRNPVDLSASLHRFALDRRRQITLSATPQENKKPRIRTTRCNQTAIPTSAPEIIAPVCCVPKPEVRSMRERVTSGRQSSSDAYPEGDKRASCRHEQRRSSARRIKRAG